MGNVLQLSGMLNFCKTLDFGSVGKTAENGSENISSQTFNLI